MTLARRVVGRLRALAAEDLPPNVAACARLHLLDAIGVGLAASSSPVGKPYRAFARDLAQGRASVLGRAAGADAADAALVNGGLIHSLEFDDTHTGSIVHGSAVMAATALAAAEDAGSCGQALIGAYARGWELLIRLGLAAPGRFQARGFQITSVGGALAAALVAAELLDLDEDARVAALGIALSQAAGVFEFLTNGSSVKSLHPGWAAHAGILAARLSRAGMTGPETAIEGKLGLFQAFAGDPQASERFSCLTDDLGTQWHLLNAAFKFSPCCHYLHPFIEAAGQLRVAAGQISGILCRVPAGAAPIICEPWERKQSPETGHAARWSLPVAVAARVVAGKVDLQTFEQPASAAVRTLAKRIDWEPLAGARFPERFEAELVCRTTDGREHRVRVDDAYGNSSRPADAASVRAKFRANAGLVLSEAAVAGLEASIDGISAASDLSTLSRALRDQRFPELNAMCRAAT